MSRKIKNCRYTMLLGWSKIRMPRSPTFHTYKSYFTMVILTSNSLFACKCLRKASALAVKLMVSSVLRVQKTKRHSLSQINWKASRKFTSTYSSNLISQRCRGTNLPAQPSSLLTLWMCLWHIPELLVTCKLMVSVLIIYLRSSRKWKFLPIWTTIVTQLISFRARKNH